MPIMGGMPGGGIIIGGGGIPERVNRPLLSVQCAL
jgi:hypothetical protein